MLSTERIASMRAVIGFLVGIIAALVALSLGVIVVQNSASVFVTFLGRMYQAPTGWLLMIFSCIGFVVAFLLLIPGRLAGAWRSWALSKQTHRLQDKLVDVQTQYALLEGEVRLLRAERQQMTGLGVAPSARPAAPGGASPTPRVGGPAETSAAAASPSPRSAAVAIAERPAPQAASMSPAPGKVKAFERLRMRVAIMRGRLKARFERLRKRSPRKSDNGAGTKKPTAGSPAR